MATLKILIFIILAVCGTESLPYLQMTKQDFPRTLAPGKLHYTVKEDGSYTFHAGNDPENFYISSADAFLQADGAMHSTADGSLKLAGHKAVKGSDSTGTYTGTVFSYMAGQNKLEAQILIYNEGEFVRFTQSFPEGLKGCAVNDQNGVLSGFPSFKLGNQTSTKSLGFLLSYGDMFGYGYRVADFASHADLLEGGQQSGPLVLFDAKDNVMILSSYSNFMAHFMGYNSTSGAASFGIMGGVNEVPKLYQIDTILYYSNGGINKAIENWGRILTTRYHKRRSYMESDFSINYLGYWTDNGAFYYYNTEPNKNYEETILDVVSYIKSMNIPYGYVQYDSWWYYKGIGDGVKNWTAMPSVFPHGIDALFESHGFPVVAHNRYWSADTSYAKKNNGSYDFFVESAKAIPYDTHFWKDLMRSSKSWGLITYEQDWLVTEFKDMTITHTNISLGRDWLMEMGEGASECDLTIQYCMALPRHMLQSVEIQSVTQGRVSGDYQPGNSQWRIGVTSMFAHALNVAPFKDTFWTTTEQDGNPYGKTVTEPNVELQAAMATLSTGPVGPSDKIGSTNVGLLMKCCRADGLILKPSRPITSTNGNIMKLAFPGMAEATNLEAEIYTTYSDLFVRTPAKKLMLRFGIALAADLKTTGFSVKKSDMYLDEVNGENMHYVAYQGHPMTDKTLHYLKPDENLAVPLCGLKDFQLWHFSPVISVSANTSIVILGERSKWAPVTSRRIRDVEIKEGNLLVEITGGAGETVTMDFVMSGKMASVTCTLPAAGTAKMSVKSMKCLDIEAA